jgi:hypothetical protein
VDLGEYCLLDRRSRGVLDDAPPRRLSLDCGRASCPFFPGAKIQAAPEVPLFLPFDYGAYFFDSFFIFLFLCQPKPGVQMFLAKAFSVLLIKGTFPFAVLQPVVDLRYRQGERVGDVASPRSTL